jgi:hypothetical protein
MDDWTGVPYVWEGAGDFWQITQQTSWDTEIRRRGGDSSCIGMKAFAKLVETVGCEHVQIRCDATDARYVMKRLTVWRDGTERILRMAANMDAAAHGAAQASASIACIKEKCLRASMSSISPRTHAADEVSVLAGAAFGGVAGVVVGFATMRRRRTFSASSEPMLG